MSEQDDEQWITERLDGVGSCADDMRAAIARGYERGKADGQAIRAARRGPSSEELRTAATLEIGELLSMCSDMMGVNFHGPLENIAAEIRRLMDDRDRLAKRCEELEALLTRGVEIVEGDDATASRLAALEQRVGGIIEALLGCFGPDGAESYGDMARRLAALRAPGVAQQWREAFERSLDDNATARRERDEALGVVRDLVAWDTCDAEEEEVAPELVDIIAAARALVAGQPVAGWCEHCGSTRVQSYPHGCPGCGAPQCCKVCCDAENARAESERLKERLAAHESAVTEMRDALATRDVEIETLRAKLAEAEAKADFQHSMKMATQLDNGRHILQGAGVDMYSKSLEAGIRELAEKRGAYVSAKLFDDHAAAARERDALRAHALKLDGLCERAVPVLDGAAAADEDAVVEGWWPKRHTLLSDLRARGEVPR